MAVNEKEDTFNSLFFYGFASHFFSKASGDIKSEVAILCLNASLAHGSLT